MRAVIQKVKSGSVSVNDKEISRIGKGLVCLIGVSIDDNKDDMKTLVNKILNLRLFDNDQNQSWKSNVKDVKGELLCVSQFTLLAKTSKGSKPDFHKAMNGQSAKEFYFDFLNNLKSSYEHDKIKDGAFGEMMDVSLVNHGPVTIELDTKLKQ